MPVALGKAATFTLVLVLRLGLDLRNLQDLVGASVPEDTENQIQGKSVSKGAAFPYLDRSLHGRLPGAINTQAR